MTYEAAASLIEFELKKILLYKLEKSKSYRAAKQQRDLYDALIKSYQLNKDLFDSYGKAYSLKRGHEDKDKCEDPLAGSDQGLKQRKTSKDIEPLAGSKSKDSKSSSSKGTKSHPKSSRKFVQAEEPVFKTADNKMQQVQGECYNAITDRLDWTNLEGQEYPFDLSKSLPLIEVQDSQVVPVDYFINNDLEGIIKGIEDMVLTLWRPVKVAYDKYALWGISR
ncbi:hypothetical protein Tco_0222373 [Tanacetum coccineum]